MQLISIILNAVAGAFFGVLTGLVLGLSVHGVVGGFVAALAALLASFLGLKPAAASGDAAVSVKAALFSVACTCSLLIGIYLRAHDSLSVPVKDQIELMKQAGFTLDESKEIVANRMFGISLSGKTASANPPGLTGLFSQPGSSECGNLRSSRFGSIALRLQAMKNAGGGWKALATVIEGLPSDKEGMVADTTYNLVCG